MKTKNLISICLIILAFAFTLQGAYGQQNKRAHKTPEQFAEKVASRMKKNLSLSDDQYKQIYDLALTRAQERVSNKEKYKDMDKETRKQLRIKNKEDFMLQLSGILNQEQMKKFQENMEKHKQHKKNKGKKNKERKE